MIYPENILGPVEIGIKRIVHEPMSLPVKKFYTRLENPTPINQVETKTRERYYIGSEYCWQEITREDYYK